MTKEQKTKMFNRGLPIIKRLTKKFFRRRGDYSSEDLYQEGCLGFWNVLDKYKKDSKASFNTFVYTVARNRIIDFLRKNDKHCTPSLDTLLDTREDESELYQETMVDFACPNPETALLDAVSKAALKDFYSSLSEEERDYIQAITGYETTTGASMSVTDVCIFMNITRNEARGLDRSIKNKAKKWRKANGNIYRY